MADKPKNPVGRPRKNKTAAQEPDMVRRHSVLIADSDWRRLEEMAKARGQSDAGIVRDAIHAFIKGQKYDPEIRANMLKAISDTLAEIGDLMAMYDDIRHIRLRREMLAQYNSLSRAALRLQHQMRTAGSWNRSGLVFDNSWMPRKTSLHPSHRRYRYAHLPPPDEPELPFKPPK